MYKESQPFFDADGDNSKQSITTKNGRIHGIVIINPNTTEAFLQLFDALAADVTVGSTTPTLSFPVPKGDGTDSGYAEYTFEKPITFKNGILYACTTEATNSTDPSTGLILNILYS